MIAALPSTKNEAGKRNPQMHSSKRAINGTSANTVGVTSGNVHFERGNHRDFRDDAAIWSLAPSGYPKILV